MSSEGRDIVRIWVQSAAELPFDNDNGAGAGAGTGTGTGTGTGNDIDNWARRGETETVCTLLHYTWNISRVSTCRRHRTRVASCMH